MEKTDRLLNPGPGQYTSSNSNLNKAPQWRQILFFITRIGTSVRDSSEPRKNVPGVGNYNISTNLGTGGAPKYSMRPKTGIDESKMWKNTPGPGNYNPSFNQSLRGSEKFTMRPKTSNSSKSTLNVPGPGQYTVRIDKDMEKPSYRFGKDKKCQNPNFTNLKNPGPGNYSLREDLADSTAPKFSFGKELRADESSRRPKTPGPGQYSYNNSIGTTGPKISMSFVKPDMNLATKKTVPGVGQYNLHLLNQTKAPEYK